MNTKNTQLEWVVMRTITDDIYYALFGKTTMALLLYFELPPICMMDSEDDLLRDHFSELALDALANIEGTMADLLESREVNLSQVRGIIRQYAEEVAIEAKAQAAGAGIDLLTGSAVN